MRLDENVEKAIEMDRDHERNMTACCIMNDNSGCVQTTEAKCSVSNVQFTENIIFKDDSDKVQLCPLVRTNEPVFLGCC